jgi:predicted MFS family arabinose efflux permease
MATKLKKYPEESAAIDTIFSPLSTAFGAIVGGFMIALFGYSSIFIFGGSIILLFSFMGKRQGVEK